MSLQLNIRKYEEKDFERLCQVHDPARKSELEYAGLPAAFLPLSTPRKERACLNIRSMWPRIRDWWWAS